MPPKKRFKFQEKITALFKPVTVSNDQVLQDNIRHTPPGAGPVSDNRDGASATGLTGSAFWSRPSVSSEPTQTQFEPQGPEAEDEPEAGGSEQAVDMVDGDSEATDDVSATATQTSRKFQQRWSLIWPWLTLNNGKMFCTSCLTRGKHNSFTVGCECLKTSSMARHEVTLDHRSSVEAKTLNKDMSTAMNNAESEQDKGVKTAFKVVYWLASENIAITKYESMMGLLHDELNVPGLSCLKVGDRVTYRSYYSANEMLHSISDVIDDEITDKITKSPVVTMFADETTDITNTKRMTLTAKIMDTETLLPITIYLRDIEYEDGTGEGLTNEIMKEIEKRNMPIGKLTGFGSDGAKVMTGMDKGVHGRLKALNPHIIHVHCMAHRLALCTAQAAKSIPILTRFQEWMTSLFYYFKHSACREHELHQVQAILNHPTLKYKEIHAVRWLSFFEALDAVFRTLDPLITYLHNREAAKDPKAKGLLKQIASRDFIFVAYLMMDVMPIVSKLCLTFQNQDLDVAKAKIARELCLIDLESYKAGTQIFTTHLEKFDQDVEKVGEYYHFKGHRLTTTNLIHANIKSLFINKLISNIKDRFPQKTLLDAFCVLAMRTVNHEADLSTYGNQQIEDLLKYYGEEQIYKHKMSPPLVSKDKIRQEWRLAKFIVHSAMYPVDSMVKLWALLATHHAAELGELLKLAHISLTLPLHTADCERVFSQQNLILTKQRNKLSPVINDRLLRVRIQGKGIKSHNYDKTLVLWHEQKNRLIRSHKNSKI